MDTVDQKTRSRIMSRVKGKNTKPELLIRRALHRQGFRYRLHDKKLPGHPDLVFPKYKAVVLINGCFWHDHGCYRSTKPKTDVLFWKDKFKQNRERDRRNIESYLNDGWRVLIIWDCALIGKLKLDLDDVTAEITEWLKHGEELHEIAGVDWIIFDVI